MNASELKPGIIVRGPVLPEPIEVLVVTPLGDVIKIVGAGQKTGQVHQRVLRLDQLQFLDATPEREPFDGDPARFRLGVEAARLGLAYEYDPYFSLSIARVDPLPHQLEAVYDYFLRLPRIRFLLADDPGAGKTIMAGLLLKELKIRGLVKRTLIVTPANLSFQWQRELKDKFREKVRGHPQRRAARQLRPEPLAGEEPGHHVDLLGLAHRGRQGEPAPLPLGPHHRGRGPQDGAYSADKKTLAYQLGESLSTMTDHYLLMTATPHKGDPENFCLFLALLDRDVYGNVKSLEEAMRRHEAPFYLRRTKEALVTFPDPETGEVKKLFTKREVRTASFDLDGDEFDFYDALTRYVEDQSIRPPQDDQRPRPRPRLHDGHAPAPLRLQRLRRPPQPGAHARQAREDPGRPRGVPAGADRTTGFPTTSTICPKTSSRRSSASSKDVVASVDPAALREEIAAARQADRPGARRSKGARSSRSWPSCGRC